MYTSPPHSGMNLRSNQKGNSETAHSPSQSETAIPSLIQNTRHRSAQTYFQSEELDGRTVSGTSNTLLIFISAKAGIEFDFLPFILLIFFSLLQR